MADSEYFKAIKGTQRASEATAAATAFSIGANTAMQGRLIAGQQEALAEARRAAAIAEATYDAQVQALNEQRAHNYAMWRQTDDGRAYDAWKDRAWLLINTVEARQAALVDGFEADVEDYLARELTESPPKPIAAPIPEPTFKPVRHGRQWFGYLGGLGLAVAVVWTMIITGAFMWTGGAAGWNALVPAIIALLSIGCLAFDRIDARPRTQEEIEARKADRAAISAWSKTELAVDKEWREGLIAAAQLQADERTKYFGFDPEELVGYTPRPWTSDTAIVDRLKLSLSHYYQNPPTASELPPLALPPVRDPRTEPHPPTRALLEMFASQDNGPVLELEG